MEPMTMIKPLVAHLADKLKENKSVQDFFSDFSAATVQWLRPIFLIDDTQPKEVITDLIENPADQDYTDAVESAIKIAIKKNPDLAAQLKTLYEELQAKTPKITDNSINISNSKNVNTGTINAGGKVTIGDNKIDQTHSGSGDNVGSDKIINNS